MIVFVCIFFFSSRRRHTRCALVTGVQTCALPISDRQTKGIGPFYIADGRMWRPLKVAEADQWLNRRGKYVVYAACLSLSLLSIIAFKAVTGSDRRSHYLAPGPAMPLLCRRRSAQHQSGKCGREPV